MLVRGAEGFTIRSIRTDRKVLLRSVEYSLRIAYCISLGLRRKKNYSSYSEGGQGLNHPFDPYGWQKALRGGRRLTIRSIRTDREVLLRSVEYRLRIAYCISLGIRRKKTTLHIVREAKALTIRSIHTDR